ncbi:MAG: DUF4157 domain-containing protein [Rubrivivax sp.]|nr:DUF4157 domain-containing protein [Rubrivivax sp.]
MKTHAPRATRFSSLQRAPATGVPGRQAQVAQRVAADSLNDSPRAAAQRQRLDATFAPATQGGLQLKALPGVVQLAGPEEEELLQGRFDPVQRAEDEELLQGRFAPAQRASAGPAEGERQHGGMPGALKAGIESLSGADLSGVKVHANSDKPAQINAMAYAQGNDIHLGPGQEQHLPHEAWHVVQQRQGRVQATVQMAGLAVNDDAGLEHEADVMGARAVAAGAQAVKAGGS